MSKLIENDVLNGLNQDNLDIYFFKTIEVISNNQLWTTNTGYLELADLESHDIDTEYDWEIAEFKFKHLQKIQ